MYLESLTMKWVDNVSDVVFGITHEGVTRVFTLEDTSDEFVYLNLKQTPIN